MLLLLRLPALLRAAGGAGLARLASTVVQVPKMGDSITEGTLIKLAVQPGERVKIDDVVCVIETDKVSVDVRAPDAGVVAAFHAALQDTVKVGASLFTLSDAPGGASAAPASKAPVAAPAPAPSAAAAAATTTPAPLPASTAAAAAHAGSRKPAIHFRHGKRENIDAETGLYAGSGGAHAAAHIASGGGDGGLWGASGSYAEALAAAFPSKATRDYFDLPARFSRPAMSVVEAAMISSGGAPYEPPPPPASDKKGAKKK